MSVVDSLDLSGQCITLQFTVVLKIDTSSR